MIRFESTPKRIGADQKKVFDFLSDARNIRELVPEAKLSDITVETDSCRFTDERFGEVGFRIASREPVKTIIYRSDGEVPFRFEIMVELDKVEGDSTLLRLILNADLNMMMNMVAGGPLGKGLEMVASKISEHLNSKDWI